MKLIKLFVLILPVLMLLHCESPLDKGKQNASIILNINFPDNIIQKDNLQKPVSIEIITITVEAADMETIIENFEVQNSQVECDLKIPKGDDRNFLIEGKDSNNIIQFEGEKIVDIIDDEETITFNNLAVIAPDPVNFSFSDITETSFDINWDKSNAVDFGFYRVLASTNPQLDPDNDFVANDITDRNSNSMTVTGAEPNTVYYATVLVCDTEFYYKGVLEYNVPGSIVKTVTTGDGGNEPITLGYGDQTYENFLYSSDIGSRFLSGFAPPAASTYIKEVWFYLNDLSSEQGNYRAVICNAYGEDVFYSNPLGTHEGEGWVGWNVTWDNYTDGLFDDVFYVGIELTKDILWPEIGLDETTNAEASYYVGSDDYWYTLSELEYSGNLGILVVVEVGSEDGNTPKQQMTMSTASNVAVDPINAGPDMKKIAIRRNTSTAIDKKYLIQSGR